MTNTCEPRGRLDLTAGLVNVRDYQSAARQLLPSDVWDYYAGGSDDEVSLRSNELAFQSLRLRPRMLVDVTGATPRTSALGAAISMPIVTAPVAYQAMAHSDGELATARASAAAGTLMIASINSNYSLEDIAVAADGPKWLQIYIYGGDLSKSVPLLRRAEDAGYGAIVLTVDRPVFGNRERDVRNDFSLPPGIRAANFGNADRKALSVPCEITWATVENLVGATELPVILKGILTAEDAALAIDRGAAGIVVSNHGGRQLDGVCAGIEALPEVVEAVAGRCEVFCDGGIRRGTDVVKALALGARAVLVGRPILWGLAVGGEAGVSAVLDCLREEFVRAMKLLGTPTCADINPSTVGRMGRS
ncbi:MAG: alpha-hydroxy acid oxidase [Mycolicibacterium sp.]|uniref:alpha-hydroxy acid oxidase n=1 Tax=Mycolicibacterium sp. TaxID=2320850 RepID=UPI003D11AD70